MTLPRGRAALRAFLTLLTLFGAGIIAATAYHASYLRETELRRAQAMATTHARVFESFLTQNLSVVDLRLRSLLDAIGQVAPGERQRVLQLALRHAPYLRSLSIIDPLGRIIASSESANVGRLVQLDWLRPSAPAEEALLQIGLPWSGRDFADGEPATETQPGRRDGLGFIPLLRTARPSLRLLAALNPDHFLTQFERTFHPADGVVDVLRDDHVVLFTSDGSASAALPGAVRATRAVEEQQVDAAGENGTRIEEDALSDGRTALVAQRASPLYPLRVTVRLDRQPALAAWRRQVAVLLATMLPAFLLANLLAFAAFRRAQRVEAARQEAELVARDRLAGQVFEASAQAIIVTDAEHRILRVNPAYTRLSGYSPAEAIGRDEQGINCANDSNPAFYQAMQRELLAHGSWQGELINRRKDGTSYPAELSVSTVQNDEGEIVNYVALLTDITERRGREERIRFLSEHDVLTGLPNRALFQDRVARTVAHAKRTGGKIALLFLDLDRFKPINDTHGHHVGDQLLQEIARRLTSSVRQSDTVARQGGDEFLIMLSGIDNPGAIARVAEKLMATVGSPCRIAGLDIQVTPSIGISVFPDDGTSLETLIRCADTAMYHSKAQGRAAYHFFSPEMNASADQRLAVETGLRQALENGGLALHYQPLVEVASGKVIGFEALLRWDDAHGSSVEPALCIPIAEECGLIAPLGNWVIWEACRQARCWLDHTGAAFPVAVNVSGTQFARSDFVDFVLRVLAEFDLRGSLLSLEIKEGTLLKQASEPVADLRRLQQAGVRLAVDDFGTDHSSLISLRRMQIERIKIDRSLIGQVAAESECALIVGTLINMAHGIGLSVLAEGVETPEQHQFLLASGCEQMQGHLVCQPLAAAETERWLHATKGQWHPAALAECP